MANFTSLVRQLFKRRTANNHIIPQKRRNEFVVIGLGRFGASLAATLHNYGHGVLAIDADSRLVQRLSNELPHVVQMDATHKEGYVELGVGSFDTALICIGTDFETNMLATVLVRQLGVRRVICKARTRMQRDILLKIGADEVILPEHEAGVRLGQKLAATGFVDFMQINEEISVIEMLTPPSIVGKPLMDSGLREKYNLVVVAIRRKEGVLVLPTAQEILQQGDILVIVGKPRDCESAVGK